MTVYLGKNPVGVGRIVEKKVAKTKFGCSVDNFIGDVDADGNYNPSMESFEVNLAGVKSVPIQGLWYRFAGTNISKFIANDLLSIVAQGFSYCFVFCRNLTEASFDAIEEISDNACFSYCFQNTSKLDKISFKKLKKINSDNTFNYAFSGTKYSGDYSEVFPELEEVSGTNALNFQATNSVQYFFPKLKKIIGHSSKINAIFGSAYKSGIIYKLPSVTEITGYVWNIGSSYAGEIHFAAANQAAIEACEGYSYKWGFAGATIYFDL